MVRRLILWPDAPWAGLCNELFPPQNVYNISFPKIAQRPCGLMDKVLVFGTKDCRFESCQGHTQPIHWRIEMLILETYLDSIVLCELGGECINASPCMLSA